MVSSTEVFNIVLWVEFTHFFKYYSFYCSPSPFTKLLFLINCVKSQTIIDVSQNESESEIRLHDGEIDATGTFMDQHEEKKSSENIMRRKQHCITLKRKSCCWTKSTVSGKIVTKSSLA